MPLEDEADLLVAQAAAGIVAQRAHVLPVQHVGAAGEGFQQAGDVEEGGLAGAGLAHDRQRAATRQGKRHAVHRLDDAVTREELRLQALHLKNGRRRGQRLIHNGRLHRVRPQFAWRGLSTSRKWSPTRLMAMMASANAMPGKNDIQYWPDNRYSNPL
ncbi:hypothetical protein G6F66_014342 [Rhizopus arrhizus]|nr:hypothetical protein G6F66_014342 [Rhizopus arrhizus]